MSARGSRDPWVAGEPIPGVTIPYNAKVRVLSGEHAGLTGWAVALAMDGPEPVYTVELESRGPDIDVPQSYLRTA